MSSNRAVAGLLPLLGLLTMGGALAGPETALVGLGAAQDAAAVHAAAEALGGHPAGCFHQAGVCALRFPGPPPLAALAALPGVRYAEQDQIMPVQQHAFPDASGTSSCTDQWELETVRAEEAWATVTGSGAPPIAIEDSGFRTTHEEIKGQISDQYDYGDADSDPEVVYGVSVPGHGTFIAGLIASDGDNGVGRAGLAPEGSLFLQKIADRGGALYYSYAISAMAAVAGGSTGARVLSYSLAGSSTISSFSDAVEGLGAADVLLVAAAANCSTPYCSDADNDRYPEYPASFEGDYILSVAGTLEDDTLNPYSHYGATSVDLAAPGADLCSLGIDNDRDYEVESGTSYATPLVAAAAALVREAHPDLSAPETSRVIKASVKKISSLSSKVASGGRLDVAAAIATPLPHLDPPADASVDQTGTLTLAVENVGGEADALLVLFHDPLFTIEGVEGDATWTATGYAAGETLDLPDVGEEDHWTLAATVLSGHLDANRAVALPLSLSGLKTGSTNVSVRLITWGLDGASPPLMVAPYEEGDDDVSGALAWSAKVTVTAVKEDEDSGDSGDPVDTDGPVDTDDAGAGSGGEDGGGDPLDSGAPSKTGGCGCAASTRSAPGAGALLLGLAGALARRRARASRSPERFVIK